MIRLQQITRTMSTQTPLSELKPPKHVGLKELDRSLFSVRRKIWSMLLPDLRNMKKFSKGRGTADKSSVFLHSPRFSHIVELDPGLFLPGIITKIKERNPRFKALLLKEELMVTPKDEENAETDNYRPELLDNVVTKGIRDAMIESGVIFKIYDLVLDYNFWTADQILKAVLPDELCENAPTSFSVAGHLAHLNLRSEYLPYKYLIGQVIMDKNKAIKTVVNKLDSIDTQFRTFAMEVIAGEKNYMVFQKENDCIFKFDFSKVYWNSRLTYEHHRLIESFQKGEAICDVMAGVGPFAVPAGKKPCLVFANDLNPESYFYLKENINSNKVSTFVKPYNLDGREFIKSSPRLLKKYSKDNKAVKYTEKVSESSNKSNQKSKDGEHRHKRKTLEMEIPQFFSQYVMNLPGSAITFIDAYIGIFSNAFPEMTKEEIKNINGYKLPIINVHHFEKYGPDEGLNHESEEVLKRIHKKVVKYLNYKIPFKELNFHLVRVVSPSKPMFCISFQLPEEVAFAKKGSD